MPRRMFRRAAPEEASVVITGADQPAGLAAARALQHLPIERVGFTHKPGADCARSNSWSRLKTAESANADAQLDAIVRAARLGDVPSGSLLLFSQDNLVAAAAKRLDELGEWFEVPLPAPEIVELLMDKTRFHPWATEHGFPVPRSVIVSSSAQAREHARQIRFPCVLKPLRRTPAWEKAFRNAKLLYFETAEDLQQALRSPSPFAVVERFLLQEWIDGEDSDIYFSLLSADREGRIVSQFTGRKLWQWPPHKGSSALCSSSDQTPVADIARRLYTALSWTGLASLEIKRDRRSGEFLIVEPTIGRNNHQSAIALAGGCNPTAAMVCAYLGLPHAEPAQPKGQVCYWADETFVLYRLQHERNWKEGLRLLLASLARPKAGVRFRWTDPRPFLTLCRWAAGRLVIKLFKAPGAEPSSRASPVRARASSRQR